MIASFSRCRFQCLGFQHAEDAFVDDSCACCGRMSMISLRSRLSFMKGLAPSATTCPGLSASRGSPASALGDLRVTVKASPPGTPPRTSYSSRSEHPVRFPGDFAGLSHGAPSISFGAPSVDRMSIALVEGREENLLFLFRRWSNYPLSQERAISFSSRFSGPWDDSV